MEGTSKAAWNPIHAVTGAFCFVGFGGIWNFPWQVYARGGGAFLIAYILVFILNFLPIALVQLKLGSLTGKNIIGMFGKYIPFLKGIGIVCMIHNFILVLYFQVFCAHALYYLYQSTKGPPYIWSDCSNVWNTPFCFDSSNFNSTWVDVGVVDPYNLKSPAADFYENYVQQIGASTGYGDYGTVVGHQAVSLLLAWIFTFILILAGPTVFGWIASAVVILAYLSLFLLLGYGYTHFNTKYDVPSLFYSFDSRYILDIYDITNKLYFTCVIRGQWSLYLWDGILPTFGKFVGNGKIMPHISVIFLYPVLLIVPNLCAIMMFTFIASSADAEGVSFGEFMSSGPSLVFIKMADAFAILEVSTFWVFAFYTFVFLVSALITALLMLVIIDSIVDGFYCHLEKTIKKLVIFNIIVAAIMCIIGFLLGLVFVTQGGKYLWLMIDTRLSSLTFIIIMLSSIAFIITLVRVKMGKVTKILLCIIFGVWALELTVVNLASLIMDRTYPLAFNRRYVYPQHAEGLSWSLPVVTIIVGLVIGVIHAIATAKGSISKRISFLFMGELNDTTDDSHPPTAYASNGNPSTGQRIPLQTPFKGVVISTAVIVQPTNLASDQSQYVAPNQSNEQTRL